MAPRAKRVGPGAPRQTVTRNRRTVWEMSTAPFPDVHFATFSDKTRGAMYLGRMSSGTILDPFSGTGTAGLVADRLGRNAIFIELNESYCEMARRRIQNDAPLLVDVTMSV